MITICIGFDDHVSVYDIPRSVAEELQGMYDITSIANGIIDQGRLHDVPDANNLGDAFLDTTGWSSSKEAVRDFLDELAIALATD